MRSLDHATVTDVDTNVSTTGEDEIPDPATAMPASHTAKLAVSGAGNVLPHAAVGGVDEARAVEGVWTGGTPAIGGSDVTLRIPDCGQTPAQFARPMTMAALSMAMMSHPLLGVA